LTEAVILLTCIVGEAPGLNLVSSQMVKPITVTKPLEPSRTVFCTVWQFVSEEFFGVNVSTLAEIQGADDSSCLILSARFATLVTS
jgi:hypothetical protein